MKRDSKYINWYTSANYDRLNIFLPKGSRERIKQEAKSKGKSLNEFIRSLIPERLIAEREYIGRTEKKNDDTDYPGFQNS